MHPTAPTPEPPKPDQPSAAVPDCIAFLLDIVRHLLRYGRQLDEVLPRKAAHPRFPTLAAGFGTHDVRRILAHVQRGILRAMMLERFLLARAAQGRDIEPVAPPAPAEQADIEGLVLTLRPAAAHRAPASRRAPRTDPDDPLHFSMPTLRELEAQVRCRPVGQTIAEICLDLGVTPAGCEGAFWDALYQALLHFKASLKHFYETQTRRRETFQKERDKRPDTWAFDWRDRPRDALRHLLDHPLGA